MPSPPFGAGFRTQHLGEITAAPGAVDCFEVLSDNFIGVGGPRRAMLERLRSDHPIVLHGVGLSIAGSAPLSEEYLHGLRELADRVAPAWLSDHLCWTSLGGHQSHDLLPVAHTAAVLDHVAERVERAQEILGRRLLLENPSAYVAFRDDEMGEAEFFVALCQRTGCGMLLDVNNLHVNAANLGIDAADYLATLEEGMVGYMHLAGHAVLPDVRIDTHDADVPEAVWALFGEAVRRFPAAGVIVERDDNLPAFAGLVAEVDRARALHAAAMARGAPFETPPSASSGRAEYPLRHMRSPVRAEEPLEPVEGGVSKHASAAGRNRWPELQGRFWTRLVDKPVAFDHRADARLDALLDDRRPVPAARGMRVYSDAYALNLRRALAVNFPALVRVVSAGDFERLTATYLCRHPPRGHDFRLLGADFAAFVRSCPFESDYGTDPGALADLVALEQAQLEVQDEIDEPAALSPESLAGVAPAGWEGARVGFVRALRLVRASHDVLPAIEAVGRGEIPERPRAGGVAYLVYRAGTKVCTERLDAAAATVLDALLAGRTLGTACAAAAGDGGDEAAAAADAARLLVMAAARGLVQRLELPATA
jgi:hypothetical protein